MSPLGSYGAGVSSSTLSKTFFLSRLMATKKFTPEHEWIEVDDNGVGTLGITDYAQKALGDVVFVELPEVGSSLEVKGAVESVKAASDIYAPISGEILETNDDLESKPSLINTDPEKSGWLAKIKIRDSGELKDLLDADAYKKHCETASE